MTKRTRIHVTRRWLSWLIYPYVVLGGWFACTSENLAVAFSFLAGELAITAAHFWLPRIYEAEARATEDGLWIGERLVVPRRMIHSAHLRARGGAAWLRLVGRHGWADVALDAPGEERAWLFALRLDAQGVVWRQTVAADRAGSRAVRARFFVGFVGPIVVVGVTIGLLPWLVETRSFKTLWSLIGVSFCVWAAQVVALLRGLERVVIGTDGLTLRRVIGRARFVPFASVADLHMEGRDILLMLHDGAEIAWHLPLWSTRSVVDVHRAFVERVAEGLAAHRALITSEGAAQLARGMRSVAAWLRDLRVASDPDRARYRVAALPSDELWKTVENATAAPNARAGAAVALQRSLDAPGRKRLRDIAATCASNRLRAALEAAATDAALEPHLAALADA